MTREEALTALGLDGDATQDEITAAYRELAQMLHPDKYGTSKRLRERAEQQMRVINEARDTLLRGRAARRPASTSAVVTAQDIYIEATIRARAAETARLAVVTSLRTLKERRQGRITMLVISLVVALVSSRLRGTVGALAFSVSSMLVVWGGVDVVMLGNQIRVLQQRSLELLRTRDRAREIAQQAQEL